MTFSDYIIYGDESGSPVLDADKEDFPIFVLVFMLVSKQHYTETLVPAVQMLKFDFTGHDQIILHERDIRRQSGAFAFLQVSKELRNAFLERINQIVEAADIKLCCAIIDKSVLKARYTNPWDPYALALTFCMEKAAGFLCRNGQAEREVSVVFEARGTQEDRILELEFSRIAEGRPKLGNPSTDVGKLKWVPRFVDKRANSTGLQIADLAARPLGLRYLRPDQSNRAADLLNGKLLFPHPKCFP